MPVCRVSDLPLEPGTAGGSANTAAVTASADKAPATAQSPDDKAGPSKAIGPADDKAGPSHAAQSPGKSPADDKGKGKAPVDDKGKGKAAKSSAAAPAPIIDVRICVPAYGGMVHERFLTSMLALQSAMIARGVRARFEFTGNESLIPRARNLMAAKVLQDKSATHLLFIDADIELDPSLVLRLLERDADIACGCYAKKAYQFETMAQCIESGECTTAAQAVRAGLDFNLNIRGTSVDVDNGYVETLDGATGIMCIKRGVLEKMCAHFEADLFCHNDISNHPIATYVALFDTFIDRTVPTRPRNLSEDFAFCRRAQQLGFSIYTDIACPTRHYGTTLFTGDVRNRFVSSYAEV